MDWSDSVCWRANGWRGTWHVDRIGVEERELDVARDLIKEMMERIGNEHIAHITGMLAHFFDDVILVTLLAEELHLWEIVLVIDVDNRQNTNTDHRRGMHVHLAADDLGGIFFERGNLAQHLVITRNDGLRCAENFTATFGQCDTFLGTVEQRKADLVFQIT